MNVLEVLIKLLISCPANLLLICFSTAAFSAPVMEVILLIVWSLLAFFKFLINPFPIFTWPAAVSAALAPALLTPPLTAVATAPPPVNPKAISLLSLLASSLMSLSVNSLFDFFSSVCAIGAGVCLWSVWPPLTNGCFPLLFFAKFCLLVASSNAPLPTL